MQTPSSSHYLKKPLTFWYLLASCMLLSVFTKSLADSCKIQNKYNKKVVDYETTNWHNPTYRINMTSGPIIELEYNTHGLHETMVKSCTCIIKMTSNTMSECTWPSDNIYPLLFIVISHIKIYSSTTSFQHLVVSNLISYHMCTCWKNKSIKFWAFKFELYFMTILSFSTKPVLLLVFFPIKINKWI